MEQSMRSLGRFHADQESGSLAFAYLPACVCVCACVFGILGCHGLSRDFTTPVTMRVFVCAAGRILHIADMRICTFNSHQVMVSRRQIPVERA